MVNGQRPFGYRDALVDRRLFYGREHELAELGDEIAHGQSVSLVGPCRIGKSSLLHYFATQRECWQQWGLSDAHVVVLVDIGALTYLAADQLLPALVKNAAETAGLVPPKQTLGTAVEWLKEQDREGRRLVFLMDEFDAVGQIPQIESRHLTLMRSLANTTNVVYVAACRRSLYGLSISEDVRSSPFWNIFHELQLGVFDEAEARQMIFGREAERKDIFTEEDVGHLRDLTAWHPMVLSLACGRLWSLRQHKRPAEWEHIEEDVIRDTIHDYRYAWERCISAAQQGCLRRLQATSREEGVTLRQQDERGLARLARMGLLLLTEGCPRLVPGLGRWLEDLEREQTAEGRDERGLADELAERVGQRVEEALHGPVLGNYSGFVTAWFSDEQGAPIRQAAPGAPCQLTVQLVPQPGEDAFAEPIDVTGGVDVPEIIFRMALDADEIKLVPGRKTVNVQPGQSSEEVHFSFQAPRSSGVHKVYVQIFQKTRLLQVLRVELTVRRPRTRTRG